MLLSLRFCTASGCLCWTGFLIASTVGAAPGRETEPTESALALGRHDRAPEVGHDRRRPLFVALPLNRDLNRDHNVQPDRNSRFIIAVASGELVTRRFSASHSSLVPLRWATVPRLTASERGPE